MKAKIEIFSVPGTIYGPAYKVAKDRVGGMVDYALNCAKSQPLNLERLACSAYLQGVADIVLYRESKEHKEIEADL